MTERNTRIGFIGAGNMGFAMISGLLNAGHAPGSLYVSDPDSSRRKRVQGLHKELNVSDDNALIIEASIAVVLAVKPQILAVAMEGLDSVPRPDNQIIISVAAGVTLDALRGLLHPPPTVIRIMPNQPAMVGAAMSVLVAPNGTDDRYRQLAQYVAESVGRAVWINDEQMIDAITAISGSGPAYFYLLAEIIEACAEEMGLSTELATILMRQTLYGAGKTAVESEHSLAELRQSVTSKGGTTAAALDVLERAGIRDIVDAALVAARERSIELGSRNSPDDS
jgi:pyrroline-5-carboxylate reductase